MLPDHSTILLDCEQQWSISRLIMADIVIVLCNLNLAYLSVDASTELASAMKSLQALTSAQAACLKEVLI